MSDGLVTVTGTKQVFYKCQPPFVTGMTNHRELEYQKMGVVMAKKEYDGEGGRSKTIQETTRKSVWIYYRDFEAKDNSHQD